MSVATISSKGQITLPAEARRALGVNAGDRVQVRVQRGAIVIEPILDFLSLKGSLGPARPDCEEREAVLHEASVRAGARE